MMFADRVYQTTSSTGASVFVLDGGAPVQFTAFANRYAPGDTVPILVLAQSGGQWQTGTAEFQSGPDRLAWLEVEDGSAGKGVAVNFAAGVKDVRVNASARFLNSTLEYVHTQGVPATVWTITHNLGRRPSVRTLDTQGRVWIGNVSYPNDNTALVEFGRAFGGIAYVN